MEPIDVASSGSAPVKSDDTFRSRVQNVFGSLTASPAWSLSGEKVERHEWNRSKYKPDKDDDDTPTASSLNEYSSISEKDSRKIRRELNIQRAIGDDDEDDEEEDKWGIRSSIGLDKTLDYEDEEDEFDRVAQGWQEPKREAPNRFHIKNAGELGAASASHSMVIKSMEDALNDQRGDPRADRMAAQIRLDEDAAEAGKSDEPSCSAVVSSRELFGSSSKDHHMLKPILKRKHVGENATSKPSKRVRFHSLREDDHEVMKCEASDDDTSDSAIKAKESSYVLDRSNYTHYSLQSTSELDEASNTHSAVDVLELGEKLKSTPGNDSVSSSVPPKSVTFVPRKKTSDVIAEGDTSGEAKPKPKANNVSDESFTGIPVGIALGEPIESEAQAAEELER